MGVFFFFCKFAVLMVDLTINSMENKKKLIVSNRITSLLAVLLVTFVTMSAHVKYDMYRLTTHDGLPSNTIFDIWQDQKGFMWFATKNGISRYDSYSMVNFTRHSNVSNLIGDPSENLLWYVHDATYYAMDLRTYQYIDYEQTDSATSFGKSVLGHRGLWVYDKVQGARFIWRNQNHLAYRDYNLKNKKLRSNNVRRINISKDGTAWISTSDGIYRVDTLGHVSCLQAHVDSPDNLVLGNRVCFLDKNQRIRMYSFDGKALASVSIPFVLLDFSVVKYIFGWKGKMYFCTTDGLFSFCPKEKKTESLNGKYPIKEGTLLDQFDGNCFVQDKNFNLWVFANTGRVEKLSLVPNSKFTHAHRRKYVLHAMKNGRIVISTFGNGLFVYNLTNGALEHFTADAPSPLISSNYLGYVFVDRQGSIWLNETFLGISYISRSQDPDVSFVLAEKDHHGDWANSISMIAPTKDGNAMVGTHDNKLYRLDAKTHALSFQKNLDAPAYCYYEDAQGHKWFGTRGGGLYVDGVRYATDELVNKAPCNDFYRIVSDKKGNIWIGTPDNGLLQTRYEQGKPLRFNQYLTRKLNESFVGDLDVDCQGNLWVATLNGLYMLRANTLHVADQSFVVFNPTNKNFPSDRVVLVKCSSDGFVWTGTTGRGMCRSRLSKDGKTLVTQCLTTQEGLANNNINELVDDLHGNLWVSTDNGLSVVDKKDLNVRLYPLSSTAEQNITVWRCGALLNDKTVAFGTLHGVALVNTLEHVRKLDKVVAPCVTDLKVNGMSIILGDVQAIFKDGMELSHSQNTLTFCFSNLDFVAQRQNLYQYYLEGVDKTWRMPTTVNTAEFANLPPGKYTLHMRTLGEYNHVSNETTFQVVILQPWYNTWVAWLFYLAVMGCVVWYIWKNWKEKFDLRQQMKMEKQLTDFRINFFTHITHEFRTPLAIIQNAVDKIVSPDGTQVSRTNIQTAKRGTRRLLRLVNQLLEFRRINTKNIRLEVGKGDIVAFVRDVYQDFWAMAKQKDQFITFTPFERCYVMLFDPHIVETIVYNLLSNAVKYTPEKGTIHLKIKRMDDKLHIFCEDDGLGINEKQKKELFHPFMHGYVSQGGMGIGLYIAHEMALKHHGDLVLLNREGGQTGCLFDFQLPLDEDVYAVEEYRSSQAIQVEQKEEKQAEIIINELKVDALNNVGIAIIEDDPDMMAQIKKELGTFFKVDAYMNGKSGYEGVCANRPALIVCDVMLPDMSGYEIVKKLKQSEAFFDIPIVMLTALDDDNHKLKGYEAGADDYVVKPCNFRLLVARIVQLITWYRKFKPSEKKVTKIVQPIQKVETTIVAEGGKEEKILTSVADRNFINKMQAVVAQHIADKDFTIDQLSSQLCMGRTKFYGKVKELLGMSPNKYIINERMRIAGELILEGELTIAEVGYRVGIIDPSYFNKCFKAYYGCVPSKYGK